MKKVFTASKLAAIVAPTDLIDVLDSLLDNGLLEEYYYDFELDEVQVNIPKDVEIKEVMAGFQESMIDNQKRSKR